MSLFSFLNKKKESANAAIAMLPVIENENRTAESVNMTEEGTKNDTSEKSHWPYLMLQDGLSMSFMVTSIRITRRRVSMMPW